MQKIAEKRVRPFIGDHPTIDERFLIHSTGAGHTLLAGTVMGRKDGKTGPWVATATPLGILMEDVAVPAAGDAWAPFYTHCEAIADGLVWADGVSAADQQTAIAELRKLGIFVR